jgi:N-acetylmuramoyl-L-alanine amidase
MKKILLLTFISVFLISFFLSLPPEKQPVLSQLQTTIIIDPGHGGIDPGTHKEGIKEKNINLAIAKELANFLNRGNINIIMTRTKDKLYLDDRNKDIIHRTEIINQKKPDLVVSIHVNSFPSPNSSGGQCFYKPRSEKSKQLAFNIQKKFRELQPDNHRRIQEGPYYLLKESKVPIVITEVGFISNLEERKRLTDPKQQKKIAQAIGEGVINYLRDDK